ncbi:MAG: protein-L-isoaspartate(D-aspartate) O-methyltransferase [Candidatus Binatia bacterium]
MTVRAALGFAHAASLAAAVFASAAETAKPADRAEERSRMVATQIAARDVSDPRVLAALREVPRHRFVPEPMTAHAYEDSPLPIGLRQTISQPFIVAKMTELLNLRPTDRVYELGTGSGYQAAVASRLAAEVYTVEIFPELAARAKATIAELGYANVHVRAGDGMLGWPDKAPFDALLVTAAIPEIPKRLVEQLKPGGRAVMPIGEPDAVQTLVLLVKTASGEIERRDVFEVRFVPVLTEPR